MLKVGERFPEFSLTNQDGKITTLKDYAGHWVVLYVYPKDDTPGCTIQAKSFTATKEEFEKYLELKPDGVNAEASKAMLTSMGETLQTDYSKPDIAAVNSS